MKNTFMVLLILVGSFFSVASDKHYCEKESSYLECDDGDVYNGYFWHDLWIPGYPTQETHLLVNPPIVSGRAVFYGPGAMEATARYRHLDLTDEYVGGVSLLTCGDIGKKVWLKRPDKEWEGPFLVVDCAKRGDLWGIVNYRKEAVEVSFETALRWNMVEYTNESRNQYAVYKWYIPSVLVSKFPPAYTHNLTVLSMSSWFNSVVDYSESPDKCKTLYRESANKGGLPEWRIGCEWKTLSDNPLVLPYKGNSKFIME